MFSWKKEKMDTYNGYSENYLRVKVKDNEIKLNSIINVK